jgi:hypothetical protein
VLLFGSVAHSRRLVGVDGITDYNKRTNGNFTYPSGEVVEVGQILFKIDVFVPSVVNRHCDIAIRNQSMYMM